MTPHPQQTPTGRRLLAAFIAAGLGLLLYSITCAPGVLWQDGATFQGRVYQHDYTGELGLALAHPLYIFLARAFSTLPLGNFAHRINLFSAFCGAATLAVAFDLFVTLSRSRWAAACAVVMLAVSHTFWTHSVIAEVYTLYGLCTFVELWMLERFMRANNARWLFAAALVNGLSVSNHLLALLHMPGYGLLIIWLIRRRRIRPAHVGGVVAAFVAGSSPYWGMMLNQILEGQPWTAVLRSAFFGNVIIQDKVLNTQVDWPRQGLRAIEYFVLNFPTPLIIAAAVGIVTIWRRTELRWLALVATTAFCINFVFAFRYRVPDQYVFFFTCYLIVPLCTAIALGDWLRLRPKLRGLLLAAALLPIGVYEVLPAFVRSSGISLGVGRDIPHRDTVTFFLRPRKNGDNGAERFAREALQTAAPDGLLIADSAIRNPLIYVRDVLGVEPGVHMEVSADLRQTGPSMKVTPESLRELARQGRAYSCEHEPAYLSDWIDRDYTLMPVGVVNRLVPKTGRVP